MEVPQHRLGIASTQRVGGSTLMRVYYWIHHTGVYDRGTGVQRVVRGLGAAIAAAGHEVVPVRWCPEREAIVRAEMRWTSGLGRFGGPNLMAGPDEGVPLHLAAADDGRLEDSWLLVPEVPHVEGEDAPNLAVAFDYARFYGLHTATIFYDLIPLRFPGYEPMSALHERYASALVAADVVLAISSYSARDLEKWWADHHYESTQKPEVLVLALPQEVSGIPRVEHPVDPPSPPIRFVAVGTVEPRKNQLEAMQAFARLCSRRPDLNLRFDIVGGIHEAVWDRVHEVVEREPRIHLHEYVPDTELRSLIERAHATVFVSLYEGFGLPVAESLWLGKPCLCSDDGATAEISAGGGCLAVPGRDGAAIERGLERLAEDSSLRKRLSREAAERPLRTWRDYGEEVVATLTQAPPVERIVVLEGSRADSSTVAAVAGGASVRRLRWRRDCEALVPAGDEARGVSIPGAGQLAGLWGVLRQCDCDGPLEALAVVRAAHGLGLRVAVDVTEPTIPELLEAADTVLFPDAQTREVALAEALRNLPRTVGLRAKLRVVDDGTQLTQLGGARPRIAAAGPTPRPVRIYYWTNLIAEQPFNTGIQRVTRLLGAALQRKGVELVPVGWDPAAERMTVISEAGLANLARWGGPIPPKETVHVDDPTGEWLLLPEVTVPAVPPGSNVARLAHSLGMKCAAIFYDLIPEKMADSYPPGAVENMREFWRTFGDVDLALPISWTAASDLQRYLVSQTMRMPTIVPCPLAGDAIGERRRSSESASVDVERPLRLLAVGTLEPRKNYPRLLRALALARRRADRAIELSLVGRRAEYDELTAEVEHLAAMGGVQLLEHVDDNELERLYSQADAAVFASWEEGFGLPVVESLWHGRPCLCHDGSAMAELVEGGGVLAIDMLDESAIVGSLVRLADEPGLLQRLSDEAKRRPIRTWDEYAEDVLSALARAGSPPGWPLPAIARRRPLLTCAITTYNRAAWLRHSLPRLLDATRPWRDVVEVVVCDNASTDETPDVVEMFLGVENFTAHRNETNVGMLGNLAATARASRGAFVWLLGDDDLLVDGAIESVLEGLATHPDVEMAYMNYAYTLFDDPMLMDDARSVVETSTPIANGGPNRYVTELREVAGLNENLFTAIYTCAFRRDHALRAYQLDSRGEPFTSLGTCVPSAVYALAALQDRPAWWVGEPAVVVNLNVSWLRWALLWHLERMPDLFEEAERQGISPVRLEPYRLKHLGEAELWIRTVYFDAEDAIARNFSLARLLERSKHLAEFREWHLPGVRRAYFDAWAAGRVLVDPIPPEELFARYGLEAGASSEGPAKREPSP